MLLSQALLSASAVGLGCGAGCGSSAFAFLSAYILSEGKGLSAALRQAASFLLGKLLAVAGACVCSAILGRAFLSGESRLHRLLYGMLLFSALWLLYGWVKERRGCLSCRHCHTGKRLIPSFAVGAAYGLSPCAPLLMVLGYAAMLSPAGALLLGIVFALASSLVPAALSLSVSGVLSRQIAGQLGKIMPWFRLTVYLFFLGAAIYGLCV